MPPAPRPIKMGIRQPMKMYEVSVMAEWLASRVSDLMSYFWIRQQTVLVKQIGPRCIRAYKMQHRNNSVQDLPVINGNAPGNYSDAASCTTKRAILMALSRINAPRWLRRCCLGSTSFAYFALLGAPPSLHRGGVQAGPY